MDNFAKLSSAPYQNPNAALLSNLSAGKPSLTDSLMTVPQQAMHSDFNKHFLEMLPAKSVLSDARIDTSSDNPADPSIIGSEGPAANQDEPLREAFHDFVGQTFFGQLLASLRTTVGEPAYFNGGQAEKIFRGQLDQKLTEELSKASADKIADPMYKMFQLSRK